MFEGEVVEGLGRGSLFLVNSTCLKGGERELASDKECIGKWGERKEGKE